MGAAELSAALRREDVKSCMPALSPSQTASNWLSIGRSTVFVDMRTAHGQLHEKRAVSRLCSPTPRPQLSALTSGRWSGQLARNNAAQHVLLLLLLVREATAGATEPHARSGQRAGS